MAAGPGGLWLVADIHKGEIERIDPGSHQRTAFLPTLEAGLRSWR